MRLFLNRPGYGQATTRVEITRTLPGEYVRFGAFGADISTGEIIGMATTLVNGVITTVKVVKEGEIADKALAQQQANLEAERIAAAEKAKAEKQSQAPAPTPTYTPPVVAPQAPQNEVPTWAWVLGGAAVAGLGLWAIRSR